MRKLLLVSGPQGSGKTTFIEHLGLAPFALSFDKARQFLAGPEMSASGHFVVSGSLDEEAIELAKRMVLGRMRRGETLVMEQALMLSDSINHWLGLAARYRYDVRLVDFSSVDLNTAVSRNAARDSLIRVHEANIYKSAQRIKDSELDLDKLPWPLRYDLWHTDIETDIKEWLKVPVQDLTSYQEVVHIGDLQGCYSVLAGSGGPVQKLDPRKFYIFVGDLLDRGSENAEVFAWFLKEVVGKPNAVLLYGNHEEHLDRWANGEKPASHEFVARTRPQLEAAGFGPLDAATVVDFSQDIFLYRYHGHQVMVTHSGLPNLPEEPGLLSVQQCSHRRAYAIDRTFDQAAPAGWEQVHGHGNDENRPIMVSGGRSLNLEDSVECGGCLRIATLSPTGWKCVSYANRHFIPLRQAPSRRRWERRVVPEWLDRPPAIKLPEDLVATMRGHAGIKEKRSGEYPSISSLNFTRGAFAAGVWDDMLLRARGLFFNNETGEVIARAYDKFFNIGERPETQMDVLKQSLTFPLVGYRKENGFLGLIGYDAVSDRLLFSSKSAPESDFTGWLKDIFQNVTTPEQREYLRRYLRDMEACLAVEVIDPAHDPHIIRYANPKLVILDVFHRSPSLEKLPYAELERMAGPVGLEVKVPVLLLRKPENFQGWHNSVEHNLRRSFGSSPIEGLVLEDAEGRMVKIKLPYYAFWKSLRSAKDRLRRLRRVAEEQMARGRPNTNVGPIAEVLDRNQHPLAAAFLTWINEQPLEELSKSIIDLRDTFEASPVFKDEWYDVPWVPQWKQQPAADPELEEMPNPARL